MQGWKSLPKSFMNQNAVFLLLTALIRNFYEMLKDRMGKDKLKPFVFRFVSVPAKWVRTARQHVLNIYTNNEAYATVLQNDFG